MVAWKASDERGGDSRRVHPLPFQPIAIGDGARKSRIRHLQDAPVGVRFLSVEPLIAPIGKLDLSGIAWVIVGGESGPGAREMRPEWVREIRDQCSAQHVAFFFKQWGGLRPKSGGRELDGREWNDFPLMSSSFAVAAE
jgi:protein gp37